MADGGVAVGSSGGRLQQQILQAAGRRYSLRLESCYWDMLATIATRRRLRLNRLVAEFAAHADGANLTSRLRIFCLEESRRAAVSREFVAERTSVLSLIENAPAPALATDAHGRIAVANPPFLAWLGGGSEPLIGVSVLRRFRFHFPAGHTVEALWQKLGSAWIEVEYGRMIHVAPGRVLAANVRLAPVIAARGKPLCVIWIAK